MSTKSPRFLCIGAQKAGTTWLYRNLQMHPGVWLPPEKELHFFDEKRGVRAPINSRLFGQRPVDARWRRQLGHHVRAARRGLSLRDLRWAARYFLLPWDDAWYSSLFAPGRGRITGELTPSYSTLASEQVADVRELLPHARIIFLMRNPVERAWSHAMMDVRNGFNSGSASDLILHFKDDESRLRTDYVRTLDVWAHHYPPEQIFVGFLEDISFHPGELLGRVCEFLGLAPLDRWPSATGRVHSGRETSIPASLAAVLAELYLDLTRELASRFGGYGQWWHYCAEHLVEGRFRDDIDTPFHAGPLWTSWLITREADVPPLQSACLASDRERGVA